MGEDDKPSRLGAAAAPAAAWHDGSGGGGGRGGAASGAGASSSVGPAANALGATAGCDELSYWQQLAAAVMAEPSTDGSNAAGSAGGGAGALHSASGGAACTRPATGSGAAAEQAAPPRGAVWPLSPPKLQQQLPERGGARGQELTVGDLVALRRRHRLPSVAPAPAGALEDAIELGAFLTAGGQGSVRRATRRADGAPLVVKSVDLSRLGPFDRALARNEAKALAALQHPNVIAFEGLYLEGDSLHLATEFADGGDLLAAIRAAKERGEHLEEHQIMAWFVQICLALDHIHSRGILHRDIKPQNVLLHGGLAKVADFGCCKVLAAPQGQQSGCVEESMQAGSATGSCGGDGSGRGGSSGGGEQAADAEPQAAVPPPPPAEAAGGLDRGSGSGGSGDSVLGALAGRLFPRSRGAVLGSSAAAVASSFVGTPQFIPPELVKNKPYSVKADVWGAGCVLFEMCAGHPPFTGSSAPGVFNRILRAAAPPLPAWCSGDLKRIVGWALQKDPERRPTLAQLFADPFVRGYLDAYSTQLQQALPPPNAAPPAAAQAGSEPVAAAAGGDAAGATAPASAAPAAAAVAFNRSRLRSALMPWGLWLGTSSSGARGGSGGGSGGRSGSGGSRSGSGGGGTAGGQLSKLPKQQQEDPFCSSQAADSGSGGGGGGGWRVGTAVANATDSSDSSADKGLMRLQPLLASISELQGGGDGGGASGGSSGGDTAASSPLAAQLLPAPAWAAQGEVSSPQLLPV